MTSMTGKITAAFGGLADMQAFEITDSVPLPAPRNWRKRLTPELKAIQPNQSVLLDKETARCLVVYLHYWGMKCATRTTPEGVRVWRLS
jgi:hypothetical protein